MGRKRTWGEASSSSAGKAQPEKAVSQLEAEQREVASQELAAELKSLYTSNALSAKKTMSLFQKNHLAGLSLDSPFCKTLFLKSANCKPAERQTLHNLKPAEAKNAARGWQRWMRKKSEWPALYWADIPMKNPKTKAVSNQRLPFLLPHEWVSACLHQPNAFDEATPEIGSPVADELCKVCEAWQRPPWTMLPLGLHGDGVPVQGRLNQSTVDFVTLNLMASKAFVSKRAPITCLESTYHAGHSTTQAIQAVIAWSLQSLQEGKYPATRHDGTSGQGQAMPGRAALVQVRGDWDWNSKWYGAPTWNELSGMRWLCKAKPGEWRTMSADDRTSNSMSNAEWLHKLEARNKPVSALFSLRGVSNATMKPDWMHVVDEGCAALVAGQVLAELLARSPGSSSAKRAEALFADEPVYRQSHPSLQKAEEAH